MPDPIQDSSVPQTRTCKRCGPIPLDKFRRYVAYAYKGKPVYQYKCVACERWKAKARYKADPERSKRQSKRWRKENPERWAEIQDDWYWNHRDTVLSKMKDGRTARRAIVLAHYGGDPPRCALCSEGAGPFLVIDHVKGGGNRHRSSINRSASDGFYRWLVQQGFPSGYRVLCHNCNHSTSAYGTAPDRSHGPFRSPDLNDLTPSARHKASQRVVCLLHYGTGDPRCACCGLSNWEYLVIDHVDGGGNEHRRKEGIRGSRIYAWLIRNALPDGFRILCHNCNFSLGAHGSCPHGSEL